MEKGCFLVMRLVEGQSLIKGDTKVTSTGGGEGGAVERSRERRELWDGLVRDLSRFSLRKLI